MRIVSWNIQWGRGADGVVDLDRTITTLHGLGEVDVICLQEVARYFPGLEGHPSSEVDDQAELLARAFPGFEMVFAAGLDLPGRSDGGLGKRACFGNVVLSRFRVGQVFRHMLPSPPDSDCEGGMQRVCVEAVIHAPLRAVRMLCTHLEYASSVQRAAQVKALCDLQNAVVEQNRSCAKERKRLRTPLVNHAHPDDAVLCGDFNFEPDAAPYRAMLETAMSSTVSSVWCDAWSVVHPGRSHAPTVGLHDAPWPGRQYCCDFVFVTPGLAKRVSDIRVVGETAASDHQPVVMDWVE